MPNENILGIDFSDFALDSTVVHNTGNESISGNKTFTNIIAGNISGNSSTTTTNANININGDAIGSGSNSITLTLSSTGVSAGTYGSATRSTILSTDVKGRLLSASDALITPNFSSITSKPTTVSGYGITDAVTSGSVVTSNGFSGSVSVSSGNAAVTIGTTVNGLVKGNASALSAATSGTDYSVGTSALTTGILKSTTSTGSLSIALAADFPTLNQSTTGNAATVTTNANLTGPVTSVGNATSITNSSVTLAKMANLAANSIIGNSTGSSAVPSALSIGQVTTLLNVPILSASNVFSGQNVFNNVTEFDSTSIMSGFTQATSSIRVASGSQSTTTLTDASASFTSAYIGGYVFWSNGSVGLIKAVPSSTTLTLDRSQTVTSGTFYTIYYNTFSVSAPGASANLGMGGVNVYGAPTFTNGLLGQSQSSATRTIQTNDSAANGVQISSSRNSTVMYSVTINSSAVGTASIGAITLSINPVNSATPGTWTEVGRLTCSSGVSGMSTSVGGQISAFVPAGYFCRLLVLTNIGTNTFTYDSGQEVLL